MDELSSGLKRKILFLDQCCVWQDRLQNRLGSKPRWTKRFYLRGGESICVEYWLENNSKFAEP